MFVFVYGESGHSVCTMFERGVGVLLPIMQSHKKLPALTFSLGRKLALIQVAIFRAHRMAYILGDCFHWGKQERQKSSTVYIQSYSSLPTDIVFLIKSKTHIKLCHAFYIASILAISHHTTPFHK